MPGHKALEFVAIRYGVESLREPELLASILESLKQSFGGFVDLGLIDNSGRQVAYNGPYNLLAPRLQQPGVVRQRPFAGQITPATVFLGLPRRAAPDHRPPYQGRGHGRRNTCCAPLWTPSSSTPPSPPSTCPVRATPSSSTPRGSCRPRSRHLGPIFSVIDLPIPPYSETTSVLPIKGKDGTDYTVGFAYIEDTPFILLVVKKTAELMKPWETVRYGSALAAGDQRDRDPEWSSSACPPTWWTRYMWPDQTRANALHQMEHTNRMASIGRLAAGVAHEINNPLAIINEKAGLIKDLFSFKEQYAHDRRLLANIDSILASVERCGRITKRLLSFARHIDVNVEPLRFKDVANEVLSFLHKEAEYRNIAIIMNIPENLPEFVSDRGKLQQIFLNLVNNAFQAMNDGWPTVHQRSQGRRRHPELHRARQRPAASRRRTANGYSNPSVSTKKKTGGTGLGLSITYGLVQELGGSMAVESEVGKGTAFTITLPLKAPVTEAGKK